MGFDAGKIEDELSWDFEAFGAGKGTTPEPTTAQVLEFQRQMKAAIGKDMIEEARRLESGQTITAADVERAMTDESDEQAAAQLQALIEAVAYLCSDRPSASQIGKLPHRIKLHFVGYMIGKFVGEASTPATAI